MVRWDGFAIGFFSLSISAISARESPKNSGLMALWILSLLGSGNLLLGSVWLTVCSVNCLGQYC